MGDGGGVEIWDSVGFVNFGCTFDFCWAGPSGLARWAGHDVRSRRSGRSSEGGTSMHGIIARDEQLLFSEEAVTNH